MSSPTARGLGSAGGSSTIASASRASRGYRTLTLWTNDVARRGAAHLCRGGIHAGRRGTAPFLRQGPRRAELGARLVTRERRAARRRGGDGRAGRRGDSGDALRRAAISAPPRSRCCATRSRCSACCPSLWPHRHLRFARAGSRRGHAARRHAVRPADRLLNLGLRFVARPTARCSSPRFRCSP